MLVSAGSSNTTSLLQVFFGEKPIGKGMLRSPDLTSLDYFVWGYVKENAFTDNPQNLEQLKRSVTYLNDCSKQEVLLGKLQGIY